MAAQPQRIQDLAMWQADGTMVPVASPSAKRWLAFWGGCCRPLEEHDGHRRHSHHDGQCPDELVRVHVRSYPPRVASAAECESERPSSVIHVAVPISKPRLPEKILPSFGFLASAR